MARLSVLGENLPPPRGNGENQLRELRDYLTRMKDELEFLLTHLGEDNLDQSMREYIRGIGWLRARAAQAAADRESMAAALAGKQDALTFDDAPTAGSGNPVKSGGVFSGLAEKQDALTFDSYPTEGSLHPVRSDGVFSGLQRRANRNMLRNWYFRGGGTGRGVFPVNQRGQTGYTGTLNIDGWANMNSATTVTLTADALRVSGGASNGYIRCLIEEVPIGKLTYSALVKGAGAGYIGLQSWNHGSTSTIAGGTTTFSNPGNAWTLITGTFDAAAADNARAFTMRVNAGTSYDILAVKLELGEEQTLAHRENGAWMLNEIPNYEEELFRCMTNTAFSSGDAYAGKTIVYG